MLCWPKIGAMEDCLQVLNTGETGISNPLSLPLFGTFALSVQEEPVSDIPRAARWLLTLLVLYPQTPLTREWLAETLWPENTQERASFYLRRTLTELRAALGAERRRLFSPSRTTLQFDPTGVWCDLLLFDTFLQTALQQETPARTHSHLEEAVALYRGPLLTECHAPWIVPERSARAERFLTALETLAERQLETGARESAHFYLRRVTETDPLRETACCRLMECLAEAGDYAGVERQFRALQRALHAELNLQPTQATVALHQRLMASSWIESSALLSPASRQRLPSPITSLIGRKAALSEIGSLLRSERLVTLTGAGGIGKTRLAIASGEMTLEHWTDGVFWGDLASLAEPTHLAPALQRVFGLEDRGDASPFDAITEFLRERHALLILDNCEHLAPARVKLCAHLLGACERLHLLATSRQPLNIGGETVWRVPALTLPTMHRNGKAETESICASEAVQLFAARAQAAQHGFRITPENSVAVAHICKTLDGIPLALELAAVWVRSLSAEQIAARIRESFPLLAHGNRAAPRRHQTLYALIAWSEALLAPKERALLTQLAVFAGGWTLEAAEAVCGSNSSQGEEILFLLNRLVEQSLVEVESNESGLRYRFLESVRQFATERLQKSEDASRLRQIHRNYFLSLAESHCSQLGKAESVSLLDRLERERDNFRAALASCHDDENLSDMALRLATQLHRFFAIRGTIAEGIQALNAGLERCGASPMVRAEALLALGYLRTRNSEYTAAVALISEALTLFRQYDQPLQEAEALWKLGFPLFQLDRYEEARHYLHASLNLSQSIGARYPEARSIALLGMIAKNEGNTEEAIRLFARAAQILDELGECEASGIVFHNWGNALREQGDWRQARRFYERSLAIHRRLSKRNWIGYNLDELARCYLAEGEVTQARLLAEEILALTENDPYQTSLYAHLLANIALQENRLDEARKCLLQATVWERGATRNISYCFWTAANIALAEHDSVKAVRFLAITIQQREAIRAPFAIGERQELEERADHLRSKLGEAAFEAEWRKGKEATLDDALALLRSFCE